MGHSTSGRRTLNHGKNDESGFRPGADLRHALIVPGESRAQKFLNKPVNSWSMPPRGRQRHHGPDDGQYHRKGKDDARAVAVVKPAGGVPAP